MQQNHIIHKQVAEISFSNKAEVQELFKKTSNLFNEHLTQCASKVFDNIVPSNTLISIDYLELDLGSLPYPINETEFIKRYEEALEQALLGKIEKLNKSIASGDDNLDGREFQLTTTALLHHFLLRGILPCWGGGQLTNNPEKIFTSLLAQEPTSLKTLLLKTGTQDKVRKRLVNQFSIEIIKQVITLIEPSQAHHILEYHKEISTLQQKEQLIKTESLSFQKSLWQFILTYLMVEMGSQFQRKMFVQSTLTQMAAHYNLSYIEVLQLFSNAIKPRLQQIDNSLTMLIAELMNQEPETNRTISPQEHQPFLSQESLSNNDDALLHYLFYGSLPVHYQHFSASYIQLLLTNELKQRPDRIKQILNKHELSNQLSKQLSSILPDALLIELVNLKQPTQTTFIATYHRSILGLQKKKSVVKAEESEFRKSLWEFIFAFLLNDRGSLFNTKAFVESNIRRLANHYNIGFTKLLVFLTQGIGEELVNINNSSTLFNIVSEILREQKGLSNTILSRKKNDDKPAPQTDEEKTKQKIFTQNALLFWLIKGYLPWWSNSNHSPATLLTNFITAHPKEGFQLLQQATQQGIARALPLKSIATQIATLLKQAPDGDIALARIKLFEQISLPQGHTTAKEHILEALFLSILMTYNETHFHRFDQILFLTNFLHELKQTMGAHQPEITKQIIAALKKIETAQAVSTANTLLKIVKTESSISSYSEKEHLKLLPFDEENLVIDGDKLKNLAPQEQLITAIELVTYFLLHNHFPANIKLKSEAKSNYLLQRLILLIYQQDSAKLANLFDNTSYSPIARMRMHDLFAGETNQQYRNISSALAPFIERDTIHYINKIWPNQLDATQLGKLLNWIDKTANATQRKKIYQTMMQSTAVTQHIATNYKGEDYWTVLHNLTSDKNLEIVKNHAYLLALAVGDSFERENLQLHLREFSLNWFSAPSATSSQFFFAQFLKFLAQKTSWNMTRLQEQIATLLPKVTTSKMAQLQSLATQMQSNAKQYSTNLEHHNNMQKTQQEQAQKLMKASLGALAEPIPANQSINQSSIQMDTISEQSKTPFKLSEGEKLYVNNAGMVLIHPFMSTYLSRLGQTEAGKFNSTEAQHRATHLLQYLVNNAQETPEQEMILNKLLCGLPIEEPIASGIEITELEKVTARSLLEAVMQNWDKMKNSSVEGLQASFLQREGMLSENDEEWTLKIEQRTYDLLLQTLPWGLSMIKYPWMNKPLMVEWA